MWPKHKQYNNIMCGKITNDSKKNCILNNSTLNLIYFQRDTGMKRSISYWDLPPTPQVILNTIFNQILQGQLKLFNILIIMFYISFNLLGKEILSNKKYIMVILGSLAIQSWVMTLFYSLCSFHSFCPFFFINQIVQCFRYHPKLVFLSS